MQFRTPIKLNAPKFKLNIRERIMLMGSCFSENITKRLKQINWNISDNSHGILFNPVSINTAIEELCCDKLYTEKDLFISNELWYSWQHHGCFAHVDQGKTLDQINENISSGHKFIEECDCVILTYGSAWVYRYLKENKVVANCHKVPQSEFKKELLSVAEITLMITNSIDTLKSKNPKLKVILTLSPVRYIKDGFVENARSKAHLLSAIHEVVDTYDDVDYFPAYEIFMDDLRDYRFAASDLVHPNEQAIDYIWEQFIAHYCNKETQDKIEELESWRRQIDHRPLHGDTKKHLEFRKHLFEKTLSLKEKYSFLDFEKEIEQLRM